MSNLIMYLIAIALSVVMAAVGISYLGPTFNQGASQAKAAGLINQAQQIQSAASLYEAREGGAVDAVGTLTTDGYLKNEPAPTVGGGDVWTLGDGYAKLEVTVASKADEGMTEEICTSINEDGSNVVRCIVHPSGSAPDAAALAAFAGTNDFDAAGNDTTTVFMAL